MGQCRTQRTDCLALTLNTVTEGCMADNTTAVQQVVCIDAVCTGTAVVEALIAVA